jgi:hypothetical protein
VIELCYGARFELTETQLSLLKALSPRGAAKTAGSLEKTAMQILAAGLVREAKIRRITGDRIGAVALVEAAARRRRERENNRS